MQGIVTITKRCDHLNIVYYSWRVLAMLFLYKLCISSGCFCLLNLSFFLCWRQVIRRRKGPAFEYLLPLIYAPVLPLSEFWFAYLIHYISFFYRLSFVCKISDGYAISLFIAHSLMFLHFLVRIALRHKPVLRDRLFYGVLAGAFAHGTYLVYPLSHPF